MNKREAKRQELTEKIADYLLAEGLQNTSLRPMALALGTSDRMLLHYFSNKEDSLTSSLFRLTDRFMSLLNHAGSEQVPFHLLVPHLAGLLKDPNIRPYVRLWVELIGLSYYEELFLQVAQKICDTFYTWIESTLEVPQESDQKALASYTMITIEGMVLIEAIKGDNHITRALESIQVLHG